MSKKTIIIFLIAVVLAFIAYLIAQKPENEPITEKEVFLFNCDDEKFVFASFSERAVSLELSDGREMTLPQTISASGARYADEEENFIFWNKGDTAFIDERGEFTFQNCLLNNSDND